MERGAADEDSAAEEIASGVEETTSAEALPDTDVTAKGATDEGEEAGAPRS